MTSIFIAMGGVTAVAVVALLAKAARRKPKKAAKGEKGEILKQLLALSDREDGISPKSPVRPRNLRHAPASRARNETVRKDSRSPVSPTRSLALRANLADAEIEAQIRQRAHELYQKRGGVGGSATDDWMRAKEEVLRQKARAAKTSS
jgi:Protein of unknown function (DUF2934)